MQGALPAVAVAGSAMLVALAGSSCAPSGPPQTGSNVGANPIPGAQRVDPAWAEPSDHAARTVDGAASIGLSLPAFSPLLQVFITEVQQATGTATTPTQREYVAHLARACDVYQDFVSLWQAERDLHQRDIWSGSIVIGPADDRHLDVVALATRYHLAIEEASEPNVKVLPHAAIQRLKALASDEIRAAHALVWY